MTHTPRTAGNTRFIILFSVVSVFVSFTLIFAQDNAGQVMAKANQEAIPQAGSMAEPEMPIADSLSASDSVTLDFKDADINNVLRIISYKSGMNIVPTPDVIGNVTIKLSDVPWEQALDVILKTYGFGYQKQGNIILVTKLENMAKIQSEEALKTEIITLRFLDAQDAQRILIPMLSSRGKISILYTRGQKGWKFGSFKIGKEEVAARELMKEKEETRNQETVSIEKSPTGALISTKADFEPSIKSRILVITDTASSLDRIKNVILPQIDKKPKQVLIETKIVEVNEDNLRDMGFDWGTGATGAESSTVSTSSWASGGKTAGEAGGQILGSQITPSIFGPKATDIVGKEPFNAGLEFMFKKLTGTQFEVILHALEEKVGINTLSSPRILTLDNQEAAILVGFHTPILSSEITAGTSTTGPTQIQTLDYYQEIGIRLNVVPQVNDEGYINMIIHPSVTSSSSSVTATSVAGTAPNAISSTIAYPIIDVRETQTQVLMKDGETIVIGGLLKDVKRKGTTGVPFLSSIPFIGKAFTRETIDNEKVDLLIFISARIVKDDEFSPEEIARLQQSLSPEKKEAAPEKAAKDKAEKKSKKVKAPKK